MGQYSDVIKALPVLIQFLIQALYQHIKAYPILLGTEQYDKGVKRIKGEL